MHFACNEVKEIELARMLWEAQKNALIGGLDYGIANRNLNIGELPGGETKKASIWNFYSCFFILNLIFSSYTYLLGFESSQSTARR